MRARKNEPILSVLMIALLTIPSLAESAILPDTIGVWLKGPAAEIVPSDQKVWREFGLQAAETAPYAANGQKYTISAYRFADATGAFAALELIRPPDSHPVVVSGTGVANASDELVAVGNYLFVFKGYQPKPEELNHVVGTAPRYSQSRLPTLPKYLPPGDLQGSQRYIIGPESLARFAPSVSPSVAAFHFSPEAALARYRNSRGETTLLLFSYPTMEMARDRLPAFQQLPGALARRSGPLVAVALNAASPDDAERLLAQVRYQAEVTVPEHAPTPKDNPGNLFLNIIILCGILIGFCLVSGIVFGILRLTLRRAGASGDGDAMISLHLSGRP